MADLGAIGFDYDAGVDADRAETDNPLPDVLNNLIVYSTDDDGGGTVGTVTTGVPISS